MDTSGGKGGWDGLREQHWDVYITICKASENLYNTGSSVTTQRCGMGWKVGGVELGGGIHVPMAESC